MQLPCWQIFDPTLFEWIRRAGDRSPVSEHYESSANLSRRLVRRCGTCAKTAQEAGSQTPPHNSTDQANKEKKPKVSLFEVLERSWVLSQSADAALGISVAHQCQRGLARIER